MYRQTEEQTVALCTTWEQQHTANERILQHCPAGTSPLLPSLPVSLPASLCLSNPLRFDPTPPTAPPQSDNPIRMHMAGWPAERAQSVIPHGLGLRNVRVAQKGRSIGEVWKCKSTPVRVDWASSAPVNTQFFSRSIQDECVGEIVCSGVKLIC